MRSAEIYEGFLTIGSGAQETVGADPRTVGADPRTVGAGPKDPYSDPWPGPFYLWAGCGPENRGSGAQRPVFGPLARAVVAAPGW